MLIDTSNPDSKRVVEGAYPSGEGSLDGLNTLPAGEKLYTSPNAPKEHNVLRQILNPGGHKVDNVAFGNNATSRQPNSS
jgi:hypothetical protein